MNVAALVRKQAEVFNALERRRCFQVSSPDSGRSCCVDLRRCPKKLVLIDVDVVAGDGQLIAEKLREPCDCSHRDEGGSHLRCDYLAVIGTDSMVTTLYIEVKTGVSDEQRDIAHGFRQVMCSKSVFESILEDCSRAIEPGKSFGVVVSPAFALSDENQRRSIVWGIANGLRLIQVRSGLDVWTQCVAS